MSFSITRHIKPYYGIILICIVIICLLTMVVYTVRLKTDSLDDLDVIKRDVQSLQTRVDTIKYNKLLTQDQITDYVRLLSALIPENEDFFSIIYSIERISQKTKFVITDYTLHLSARKSNKIALSIGGKGDVDEFTSFLETYMFGGGRLATIEKIQFSEKNFNTAKLSINFYSNKSINNLPSTSKLIDKDIDFLNTVKEKITIDIKDEESLDYPTKNNPFN